MKKLTLILTIILSLCFSLSTTCSLAEENNTLKVLLTTDKAEYTGGKTIVATLTVTNNYVWSCIYTLDDDGSVGDFVVDFDEYVAGNGLGELRFNTNIPTNYPAFNFWIDNPID